MLIEFRVKNFRSFRDEQVLSLVAGNIKDDSLEENCIEAGKYKLLKTAAIYGPNASGKSNLIKALGVMRQIVLNSANNKPGDDLSVVPYRLDAESEKKPTEFAVTFIHEKIRYQYGFAATRKRIKEEWLFVFPIGRARDSAQNWFERRYDRKTKKENWNFKSSFFKGQKQQLKEATKPNALFLSVAAQWNNKQLTTVYEWFQQSLRVLEYRTPLLPVTADGLANPTLSEERRKYSHEFVELFLQAADFGVSGVRVERREIDKLSIPDDMPAEIWNDILKNIEKGESLVALKVEMLHDNLETGQKVRFLLEDESDGTQRLFELAIPWLQAALAGMTVVIDELEARLHPLLTRELVKFFQNVKNTKGAQLIFATHDTTLLDQELLRRDQVWFTEKDEKGASHLYSMLDYKEHKARVGEAMQKGYLAGRYGAVPILKAFDIQ